MIFRRILTDKKIKQIYDAAINASDGDAAWVAIGPLLRAQPKNNNAADALISFVQNNELLSVEQSLEVLSQVYEAHKFDDEFVILVGLAMEAARDLDFLNDAPPTHTLFAKIVDHLSKLKSSADDQETEARIVEGLSGTARLMGRQYDNLAFRSYSRLVELIPEKSWTHYNQGLFFKTRGYFFEGLKANKRAIELAEEICDSYQWNLGICATGAGEGEEALSVWKEIGQKIELGRFELPEGLYPSCKVRLAQRPLSERTAENDDPGLEETIWIERLSPCHGIIRSVLYQNLGVNYGDVILFDGAPITYHTYGDQQIPVFPHLATIQKRHYQFYDFAGTQRTNGDIGNVSENLNEDSIIYSHTENFSTLCSTCWQNENIDHEHKESEEKHIVTGRIAAPPNISPEALLESIDSALCDTPERRIFSPDLCRAAKLEERARFEEHRYKMLTRAS